jgi:hypothetical protein
MDLKKEVDQERRKYRDKVEKHRKETEKKSGSVLDDKDHEFLEEFYDKVGEIVQKDKKKP